MANGISDGGELPEEGVSCPLQTMQRDGNPSENHNIASVKDDSMTQNFLSSHESSSAQIDVHCHKSLVPLLREIVTAWNLEPRGLEIISALRKLIQSRDLDIVVTSVPPETGDFCHRQAAHFILDIRATDSRKSVLHFIEREENMSSYQTDTEFSLALSDALNSLKYVVSRLFLTSVKGKTQLDSVGLVKHRIANSMPAINYCKGSPHDRSKKAILMELLDSPRNLPLEALKETLKDDIDIADSYPRPIEDTNSQIFANGECMIRGPVEIRTARARARVRYGVLNTGQAYVYVHITNNFSVMEYCLRVPPQQEMPFVTRDFLNFQETVAKRPCALPIQAARESGLLQDWPGVDMSKFGFHFHNGFQSSPRAVWTGIGSPQLLQQDGPPPRKRRKVNGSECSLLIQQTNSSDDHVELQKSIHEAEYCTHDCLLALTQGRSPDTSCPNYASHPHPITSIRDIRRSTISQLSKDRYMTSNCTALGLSGHIGELLKIRLKSSGYTFVAKGVESCEEYALLNEEICYKGLKALQGDTIPVCLGKVVLSTPYLVSHRKLSHLLLLSYAGPTMPIHEDTDWLLHCRLWVGAMNSIEKLTAANFQQNSIAMRNLCWDASREKMMIIDLQRGKFSPSCSDRDLRKLKEAFESYIPSSNEAERRANWRSY